MRKTVKRDKICPGYYVAFGSDLGMVGFFKVKMHQGEGLVVWGLSRWRGSIAYRTLGIPLDVWLDRQAPGVQYRQDIDRTNWPDTRVPERVVSYGPT